LERTAEARRWFSEAEWDYETARDLHSMMRFNAACFYAQQAAEKAVKAALYMLGDVPLGHSIRELLERFSEISGRNVDEIMPCARELDRHYIPARYPNAHPSGTPHEAYDRETAGRALQCAERILNYVRRFLGS